MLKILLLLIVTAATLCGDPSPDAEAFLAVPGSKWNYEYGMVQDLPVSKLPAGIIPVIDQYYWGSEGTLPSKFRGFRLDLNGDGDPEYFLLTPYSGSGGPDFMILTKGPEKWRIIGSFQGSLHVMPSTSGWPDLIITTRGGGGKYSKEHLRYKKKEYETIESSSYDQGQVVHHILSPN